MALIPPVRLPSPYPEMDSGTWNSYQILENFQFMTAQITAIRRALGGGTWSNPMTDLGDLVRGQADGLPTRIPIGTPPQVLAVVTGVPTWTLIGADSIAWPLLAPDGTETAPSYSFASVPGTGMSGGPGGMGFSINGASAVTIEAGGGNVGMVVGTGILIVDGGTVAYLGSIGTIPLDFYTDNTARWRVAADGHFLAMADNAVDLGDVTHQIRTCYVGTSVNFAVTAPPGTPATNWGALYQKSDKKLYFKDDTGTETALW